MGAPRTVKKQTRHHQRLGCTVEKKGRAAHTVPSLGPSNETLLLLFEDIKIKLGEKWSRKQQPTNFYSLKTEIFKKWDM